MNREQFLKALRHELRGMAPNEQDEIVADYQEYFRDAASAGRHEEEVVRSLGLPKKLARELRAEVRIKDWQNKHSPSNFARMLFAVAGLGLVNMMVLPVLLSLGLGLLALFAGAVLLILVGSGLILASIPSLGLAGVVTVDIAGIELLQPGSLASAGIGVLCGGMIWLFANAWMSKWYARGLVRYARLNYGVVSGER